MRRPGRLLLLLALLAAVGAAAWLVCGRGAGPAPPRAGARAEQVPGEGPLLEGVAVPLRRDDAAPAGLLPPADRGRVPPRRVHGTVRAGGGGPAPGAHVEVHLELPPLRRRVGSVRAGEDGAFVVELGGLANEPWMRHEILQLVVVSWSERLGSASARVVLHADGVQTESQAVHLVLTGRSAVRGRVVSFAGDAAAGARVVAVGSRSSLDPHETTTDDEGRFVLVSVPGDARQVCAHAVELGAGSVDAATTSADGLLPDVVLRPLPFVAGHVRYPDGSPVDGVRVELKTREHIVVCEASTRSPLFHTVTKPDGSFRFHVPYEGACSVSVRGAAPLSTRMGVADLVLRVDLARVRMALRTPDGRPVVGLTLASWDWSPERAHVLDDLLAGRMGLAEAEAAGDYWFDRTDTEGRLDLWEERGTAVLLQGSARGIVPVEHGIRVPMDRNEVTVDATVRTIENAGAILIRWKDPEGAPVEQAEATLTTALGSLIASARQAHPLLLDLVPPGRHVVNLEYLGLQGYNPAMSKRWILDQQIDVVVLPDKTTDLELVATYGGRVRLAFEGVAPGDETEPPEEIRARAVSLDGRTRVMLLLSRDEDPAASARVSSSEVVPDRPRLASTLLAPGRWRVQVARGGSGWDPILAESQVEVRARDVADVVLRLPAR